MRRLILALPLAFGCAHGEKKALAVLAVSVDETAVVYAEAKRRRLVYCQTTVETVGEARECMGPYYGDRGTALMEAIVAAQEAMAQGVEALDELRELIGEGE